ncbi:MAG: MFS transporter [Xanthobacteraceae bacterium]
MLDRTETPAIEPIRAAAPPARRRFSVIAPFQIRSFRFQWSADLLTSWAFEMETIILGWYVLVETRSVLWLTMFGAVLYLGTLVAPLFGVAGDRLGHRNVLLGMRVAYAVFAGTLLMLALAGAVTPLVVLVISCFVGMVRPSDLGVRSALVADNMPPDRLIPAMSIARTTSDSARVAGALAGASIFEAFGLAPAYVMVTCFYVLGALLMLGVPQPVRQVSLAMTPGDPNPSAWFDLKAGVVKVRDTPTLLALVSLAFLANLTAFPLTNGLLPYVAKNIYAIDQTGLGLLVAAFASGALVGSIVLSHAGGNVALPRLMIVGTLVWYALLLIFAQMPGAIGGAICLLLAGFMQTFCMVPLSIILLRAAGEKFRGRVMGVRMMAIYSLPLGLLAAGPLIDWFSWRATASLYATIGLIFTMIIALRWRAEVWRA